MLKKVITAKLETKNLIDENAIDMDIKKKAELLEQTAQVVKTESKEAGNDSEAQSEPAN